MVIYQHNVKSIKIGEVEQLLVGNDVVYATLIIITNERGDAMEINLIANSEEKLGLSC